MKQNIRIVIADDHELVRKGLKVMLEDEPNINIVGECENGFDLVNLVMAENPDLLIIDYVMPKMNGAEALKAISAKKPDIKSICITMLDDKESVFGMYKAGANGYLKKSASKREVMTAIDYVMNNKEYYCEEAIEYLIERFSPSFKNVRHNVIKDNFTFRELEIIKKICEQKSVKEISIEIFMSERTIENIKAKIMEKMHVGNSMAIIIYALKQNLVNINEIEIKTI